MKNKIKVSTENIMGVIDSARKKLNECNISPKNIRWTVMSPFTYFRISRPEVFYWAKKVLNKKYYIHFRKSHNKIFDKRTAGGRFIQKRFKEFRGLDK